jgi:transcriptional regulator with XRE-family HTH domain
MTKWLPAGEERREILDVKAVARVLGCSISHVSNILNGKVAGLPPIPHVRAGRLRLVRREVLMRWFQDREAEAGRR